MARLKHLVVVVPGIGGSRLQTPEGVARWDQHRRRLVGAAFRPERLRLDRHPALVPVGLLPDITVLGPFVVPGYDGLVRKIRNHFDDVRIDVSVPGRDVDTRADLVLFPYDFRYSVAHAAERLAADIDARLGGEHAGARRRRVIVVAHSMGGLVARYWTGPLGGAADCAALITLGTPHRGAPKALEVLGNGLSVGRKRLTGLTGVLRQWPSAYELLPRYPMVAAADGGPALMPHELAADATEAASFAQRAKHAFEVHREIETTWAALRHGPDEPEVTAVFGRGHTTLQHALLPASGTGLTVRKEAAHWLPNRDWHGDGTVPAISAIPIELDDPRARRAVPERHLALGSSSVVVDVLAEYEGEPLDAVRGDAPDRPWLGLDLEETAATGEPVPVEVALHGTTADERTRVQVRARPQDGRKEGGTPWLPCTGTGDGRWHGDLPPLAAGAYTVEVAAGGVPVVGRLGVHDVMGVLDPETADDDAERKADA
ncbi:lipase/acyltransferase domain-containing protein [Streptomyces avidinii]|uniref:Lecithin:cholesterol acyltransferase n=1 Tax=Streptomyces avidinii TaxID=1895 RepID=A0ABS4L1M7_STRAV|nr:hypothetical protein [Streptomyces avidinii]MBP2036175.1 hypothetical protein [Streptomyces avidinii]GGY83457.1 hypothetical protein GCM10010343_05430 [Streptomyces avidinii]